MLRPDMAITGCVGPISSIHGSYNSCLIIRKYIPQHFVFTRFRVRNEPLKLPFDGDFCRSCLQQTLPFPSGKQYY